MPTFNGAYNRNHRREQERNTGEMRCLVMAGLCSTESTQGSPANPISDTVVLGSRDRDRQWYCIRGDRPTSPSTNTATLFDDGEEDEEPRREQHRSFRNATMRKVKDVVHSSRHVPQNTIHNNDNNSISPLRRLMDQVCAGFHFTGKTKKTKNSGLCTRLLD